MLLLGRATPAPRALAIPPSPHLHHTPIPPTPTPEQGCELCPTSEDVWLEAARLQTPENAKAILARGVAALPDSVKIWMQVGRCVFVFIFCEASRMKGASVFFG